LGTVLKKPTHLLKNCSKVLGCTVFVIPFFVLTGWQIGNETMTLLVIGSAPMNPLTAVLFILIGGSILFSSSSSSSRVDQWLIPVIVLVVSLYHLVQFKFDLPFRVDTLVFGDTMRRTGYNNTMAPGAAVGFALVSIYGILQYAKPGATFQQAILLTVLTGVVFMITGYLFHVPEFYYSIRLFPALQTCVLFLLLTFSILLSRPEEGLVKLLIGNLEGSRIGRLLVPVAIAIPFVFTYLRLLAQRSGWVSVELGVALVLLGYVIILTFFLFITVSSLNARDQVRNGFLKKIRALNAELKEVNEQQRASNEELATSNEEIMTANEELFTMNEQLALASETIRAQNQLIIEQKEEALKRSHQYLEIFFSNTKEEILLMDAEGRLVLFNNAMEEFILKATGKKPRIGMHVWDMTVPLRREESRKLFQEALKGDPVFSEATFSTPEGEVVHALSYEPVIAEGRVTHVTLISIDITERKLAEAKLKKQFEELGKINYELDHFVYSVSHDLRAPLSSILGLINVAELEKSTELPFLSMIKGRVNHLDKFIKDILDYSRNSRTGLHHERIDFLQLLEETKGATELVNGFDRLKIKLVINGQAPFYSDINRLRIIFNNLVSNAVKFQNHQAQDPVLLITVTTTEDKAEITATDNGIGIAPEHIGKIFDMFYRATDRSKGSGIGLYIVKEAVTKLNGTVKVKSVPGMFTTFEIVIPNHQITRPERTNIEFGDLRTPFQV
jgi:PAS domain S-box-containing protein